LGPVFDSAEIAAATGGRVVRHGNAGTITANNQTLVAGEWFVALAGDGFDDHRALPDMAARGAAGAIVTHLPDGLDLPAVVVDDTWQALRDLGSVARRSFDGPVVAVTGSCGKTTTRALIGLAMSSLGEINQTVANQNHEPGVPLRLLSCPARAGGQLLELGTFRPGEIERLARVVDPDVRVITHIGPAHLDQLGDLDGVLHEKGALFRTAKPGDVCILNLDDPRLAALELPEGVRRVTFGMDGDVQLLEATLDPRTLSTTARWRTPTGVVSARLPSPARFVAENAAAALAVAWSLDIDLTAAAAALEGYTPVGARLRTETVPPGAVLFNDSFNANPRSVAAALTLVAGLPGRRAAMIGDMMALGADEARFHDEIATLAGTLGFDLLIFVGPRMTAARAQAPGALAFAEPADAVPVLRDWLRRDDRVLLKASRALRLDTVFGGLWRGDAEGLP